LTACVGAFARGRRAPNQRSWGQSCSPDRGPSSTRWRAFCRRTSHRQTLHGRHCMADSASTRRSPGRYTTPSVRANRQYATPRTCDLLVCLFLRPQCSWQASSCAAIMRCISLISLPVHRHATATHYRKETRCRRPATVPTHRHDCRRPPSAQPTHL
jgi:hypothetical protein